LVQRLPATALDHLRGQQVQLQAFVRSPSGHQQGRLVLIDDRGNHRHEFVAGEEWQAVQLTYRVPDDATHLVVALGAGPGESEAEMGQLHVDQVQLLAGGVDWLQNGGGEAPAALWASTAIRLSNAVAKVRLWIGPGTSRKLGRWLWWLQDLPSAVTEGRVSWARVLVYGLLTFAGFWGNFGWLMVPLSPGWYLLLALVTFAAAGGWLRWWTRSREGSTASSAERQAGIWFAWGLGLALLQAAVPMVVQDWQPQGRYLLPVVVPAGVCLALGWRAWLPRRAARYAAVVFVGSLVALNVVCLACYVFPYFHG
jgi:hypothetical protein